MDVDKDGYQKGITPLILKIKNNDMSVQPTYFLMGFTVERCALQFKKFGPTFGLDEVLWLLSVEDVALPVVRRGTPGLLVSEQTH